MVFPFLLSQADQGDLMGAKATICYGKDADFREAIGMAMETAPLAGTRHGRFFERTTGTEMGNHGQANHPTSGQHQSI